MVLCDFVGDADNDRSVYGRSDSHVGDFDLAAFVSQSVASGKYATPDDVVAAALRSFRDREQYDEWLRREIQKGLDELDRGEGIVLNNDEEIDAFFDQLLNEALEKADAVRLQGAKLPS